MDHEVALATSSGRLYITVDDDLVRSMGVDQANYETSKLFVSSWLTLLSDSPLNPDCKPRRLYYRFINMMRRDGLKATVVRFTSIAHSLVANHHLTGTADFISCWIDDFKDTPVFWEYHHYYRTCDVTVLDFLYTFLNFGKKLEYEDPSFNEVAFRDWCDVEKKLADLEYDPWDLYYLRGIMGSVLAPFRIRDFRPKFGPGSVAERRVRGRIDKINTLRYSPLIDRFLFNGLLGSNGLGGDSGLSPDKVIPDPSRWNRESGISSRTSLLQFVPRDLRRARSVCMEPNTLMYSQQGVLSQMLELVADSSFSRFIRLEDQSRNMQLALLGSYTGEIDTIDLSAASDSVGIRLVKGIFPKSWLIPMLVTRSNRVQTPDGIKTVEKFAPMGSALCFPTQCLIFTSVCIYAACLYSFEADSSYEGEFSDWMTSERVSEVIGSFSDDKLARKGQFQPLAVYGDDICVDTKLTQHVVSILTRLGFSVNTAKSFTGGQAFRESCGGYYLNGSDITPQYFRVKGIKGGKLTPSHIASTVHMLDSLREGARLNTARFLFESLNKWPRKRDLRFEKRDSLILPLPFLTDTDERFGFHVWGVPYNGHLKTRYNHKLCRSEVRSWTISYSDERRAPNLQSLDAYEYMRWWARPQKQDISAETKAAARVDRDGVTIKWKWIPLR